MARQLVVATIYHHGTVSKADTWFLAESELDSFSKLVKMSYFGGNMKYEKLVSKPVPKISRREENRYILKNIYTLSLKFPEGMIYQYSVTIMPS